MDKDDTDPSGITNRITCDIRLPDMPGSHEGGSSGSSPSTTAATSELQSMSVGRPWDMLQVISRLPAVNFSQTASSVRRGLSSLLEDTINVDANSGGSTSLSSSSSVVSSSSSRDATSSTITSFDLSSMTNISMERAALTLAELKQGFLTAPTVFQGFMDRVHTTWRGSAEDIGWLKRLPGVAPVEDQTHRFGQILGSVCNGVHSLPDNMVYLLVPGLFSNYGPLYFVDTKDYFSKLGLTCHIAKIHSEAAVETNANVLKDYIEELYWGSGKQVAVLGHSKGGVDAAAAVAMNWPTLKGKVAGLVLVQSPYAGSPIASDILREGQVADVQTRHLVEMLMHKMIKGDVRALEDLTYTRRKEFLSKHRLPCDFPIVSFHTEVSMAPNVFATMSHIAHAELPWLVSSPGTSNPTPPTKLPVVVPLPALMAFCAKHIELRYGHKSDGLVVREDAEVPGSIVVKPDRKLDHGWMVYSPARKESNEPNSSQMCESLLTLLLEVHNKRKSE